MFLMMVLTRKDTPVKCHVPSRSLLQSIHLVYNVVRTHMEGPHCYTRRGFTSTVCDVYLNILITIFCGVILLQPTRAIQRKGTRAVHYVMTYRPRYNFYLL